ncbi:hypothetical protein B484DRAFT_471895, partial [Ochromonadaceae sp. CCMP2298]
HLQVPVIKNVIKANWLDAQVEREHPIGFVTGRGGFTADLHVEHGRERFAIDVSVTDPACATNLRYDADSKYGAGGAARADNKRRHYGPLQNVCVDHRDLDDDFQCPAGQIRLIPFVFEATGHPDVMVMKFLKLLGPENNDRRFIEALKEIKSPEISNPRLEVPLIEFICLTCNLREMADSMIASIETTVKVLQSAVLPWQFKEWEDSAVTRLRALGVWEYLSGEKTSQTYDAEMPTFGWELVSEVWIRDPSADVHSMKDAMTAEATTGDTEPYGSDHEEGPPAKPAATLDTRPGYAKRTIRDSPDVRDCDLSHILRCAKSEEFYYTKKDEYISLVNSDFKVKSEGRGNLGPLIKAMWAPGMSYSMASVSSFDRKGSYTIFGGGKCLVVDSAACEELQRLILSLRPASVILTASLRNRLYHIDSLSSPDLAAAATSDLELPADGVTVRKIQTSFEANLDRASQETTGTD